MTDRITDFNEDVVDDDESSDAITPFLDAPDQADATSLRTVTHVDESDGKPPELPEHVNVLFIQTMTERQLSKDAENGLKQLLWDHQDTFATSKTDIGFCKVAQHDIDTGDTRPIKQSPRRPPLNSGDAEDRILDDMLSTGVIQPSDSAWASPVCLVKKRDGTSDFVSITEN